MELEQARELEDEEAEEDDEVKRPGRETLSQFAQHTWAAKPSDDAHGTEDPEESEDPESGHATEEVEDAAPVAEVPPFRRRGE